MSYLDGFIRDLLLCAADDSVVYMLVRRLLNPVVVCGDIMVALMNKVVSY